MNTLQAETLHDLAVALVATTEAAAEAATTTTETAAGHALAAAMLAEQLRELTSLHLRAARGGKP